MVGAAEAVDLDQWNVKVIPKESSTQEDKIPLNHARAGRSELQSVLQGLKEGLGRTSSRCAENDCTAAHLRLEKLLERKLEAREGMEWFEKTFQNYLTFGSDADIAARVEKRRGSVICCRRTKERQKTNFFQRQTLPLSFSPPLSWRYFYELFSSSSSFLPPSSKTITSQHCFHVSVFVFRGWLPLLPRENFCMYGVLNLNSCMRGMDVLGREGLYSSSSDNQLELFGATGADLVQLGVKKFHLEARAERFVFEIDEDLFIQHDGESWKLRFPAFILVQRVRQVKVLVADSQGWWEGSFGTQVLEAVTLQRQGPNRQFWFPKTTCETTDHSNSESKY